MAISPNDNFTAGQVLTATECNQFPRGVMARATSTTNYTLTTSTVIATGMTVTFAADSTRMYKITYYEPYVETSTAGSGSTTTLTIRPTNAAGTAIQSGFAASVSVVKSIDSIGLVGTVSGITGSVTYVGCAVTSSATGTPLLQRTATAVAYLLVEDIGIA